MAVRQLAKQPGKRRDTVGLLLLIASLALFGLLIFVGALPLLCLFLPTLLALIVEREPGRPMTRTLLLFGFAGAWDAIGAFWQGWSLHGADVMAMPDVHAIARAWLAQAGGCLLAEVIGLGFVLLVDRESARTKADSEAEIAALKVEWSLNQPGGNPG